MYTLFWREFKKFYFLYLLSALVKKKERILEKRVGNNGEETRC